MGDDVNDGMNMQVMTKARSVFYYPAVPYGTYGSCVVYISYHIVDDR